MLTPESYGELEFVSVNVDNVHEAIESLKSSLPDDERTCPECAYTASTSRWGVKTFGTTNPQRIALVLCCPSCEGYIDLPSVLK